MNPDDLQKLVTMTMPFGKYKGKLLADLPGNYLHWFAREGFPKGELGRLLALMRENDISGMPVVEGTNLVGIVTSRDVRFETNYFLTVI